VLGDPDGAAGKKVRFFKHMAKQLVGDGFDKSFLASTKNVILLRHPRDILLSYHRALGEATMEDTGLKEMVALLDDGKADAVVVNSDLLGRPEGTLRALCDTLGIEFSPDMLSWPQGRKDVDGLWGDLWYHATRATTGFKPVLDPGAAVGAAASVGTPLPDGVEEEVERCAPLYEQVLAHRLRPAPVLPDARNADILVHIGGQLLHRSEAKVSVFDSSVQGGDAVWEGLRIYDGKVCQLEEHIDRLLASAHTMMFAEIPSRAEVRDAVFETLRANNMRHDAHIRLTLTRGEKVSSGMPVKISQSILPNLDAVHFTATGQILNSCAICFFQVPNDESEWVHLNCFGGI